jgi:segregation and condensation protein B
MLSNSNESTMPSEEKESAEKEAAVEAALFIAGRFVSVNELVALTGINPLALREILGRLQKKYTQQEGGLTIIVKEDNYKMDVKEQFKDIVNKLATGKAEFSKAEQETLAVIAYKQPLTQALVVKIRGNKAYEHIKHFIQVGLIKAKPKGHTLELTLSESFYDYFGLQKAEK